MNILKAISDGIWGLPLTAFILSVGAYYSVGLKFIQVRGFKRMIKAVADSFKSSKNSFAAFSTSLAATVGTGSVIGVSAAIGLGGAGAIFWMWIAALFGMAISYAEGVLSIKYRKRTSHGYEGGMMYIIKLGLGSPFMGKIYAFLATIACFGMGIAAQSGTVSQSINEIFSVSSGYIGITLAVIIGICIICGSEFISKGCSVFLPILAIGYILLTLTVTLYNYRRIPSALCEIFTQAIGLKPILGGSVGYGIKTAISQGMRRGIFSTEAGLGTTAAIHAKSVGVTPYDQGYINMFEVFVDTFVISTLTALMILTSDIYKSGVTDSGLLLGGACAEAFGEYGKVFINLSSTGFAFATAIGWSGIGSSAYSYLSGGRHKRIYCVLCMLCAYFGAVFSLDGIFSVCDIANGLMALPSLTALVVLGRDVRECREPSARGKPQAYPSRWQGGWSHLSR